MTPASPTFQRTRDLLQPALRAAVRQLDPASAAMASYHLGWTDEHGRPRDGARAGTGRDTGGKTGGKTGGETDGGAGGKALRPTLALLSARAAGVSDRVGLPGAVAVELVHNFSLIHDDVMDRDELRRHRPTVWAVWGVPSAILTGDAMLVAAHRVLLAGDTPYAADALDLLLGATRALIRGQTEDLEFERRDTVTLAECQEMSARKTGALLSASAAIGAVLAGAPDSTTRALASYGEHLGAAFQLVDDLLGIWGDPAVTGKPVLSDLASGKKSLPVAYAMSRGGSEELARRLRNPSRNLDELRRTAELVEAAGGREWAEDEADRQVQLARKALGEITIDDDALAELEEVADFVVSRRS